ncbi:Deoxycytidine monophosphate (dCMP) deaminase [Mortierella sp. GBA43]|nr:Deoxycytidine monophosphate (dCMP) deaminase [Mortierella sp. GBA43]
MFVGIVGPTCCGKHEAMNLLASLHGFTRLYLKSSTDRGNQSITPDISNGSNTQKTNQFLEFETASKMLDHVTLNWMEHFVTCDVQTMEGISILRKRPFFLLLSVESPIMVRYHRCIARCERQGLEAPTLEKFVEMTDAALYGPSALSSMSLSRHSIQSDESQQDQQQDGSATNMTQHNGSINLDPSPTPSPPPSSSSPAPLPHFDPLPYKLFSMADLSLLNNSSDLGSLQQSLEALDITNPDLLRPSWDSYFMYLANLAARRSNCMKRRVGCVLVRDKRVIATGYNGTPKNMRNCNDGGCPRCNQATPCGQGLDRCLCMHAEENALLEAGRERIGSGSIIYCNTCPCLGCAIKIVQVGVSQVVYSESYGMDDLTADVFRTAGVELRQHATPCIRLD